MLCSDSALNATNEISRQLPIASKEMPKEFRMANIQHTSKAVRICRLLSTIAKTLRGMAYIYSTTLRFAVSRGEITHALHTHARLLVVYSNIWAVF